MVFGSDASGGTQSKDPRNSLPAWAVVAAAWSNGTLKIVGHVTKIGPPGTTILQGEAMATNACLARAAGRVNLSVDCKPALRQAEPTQFKESHWPAWTSWEQRHRLDCAWVRSHVSEKEFEAEFGAAELWHRQLNEWADQLCGARAASELNSLHLEKVLHLDDLSRQVSLFLAQRAETLLQSNAAPELSLKQNPSKKFKKGRRQGPKPKQLNQHRPGEDGGLNKLERLKLLVQDRSKGHDWYWNQAKNPSISCRNCTLYIKQISGLDKFGLLEKHTCRHWEAEWNPLLPKRPSHDMYNLGRMRRCYPPSQAQRTVH